MTVFSLHLGSEARVDAPIVVSDIVRVRRIISRLGLECECQSKLDGALHRFEMLESLRQRRDFILDARHQAERISALLDFARELDELTTDELDLSVYEEIALLFISMEVAAAQGAGAMRAAMDCRTRGGAEP